MIHPRLLFNERRSVSPQILILSVVADLSLNVLFALVLSGACLTGVRAARTLDASAPPEHLWAAFRAFFFAHLRRWRLFFLAYPALPIAMEISAALGGFQWQLHLSFDDLATMLGNILAQLCMMLMIVFGCALWVSRCRQAWTLTLLSLLTLLAFGYGWTLIFNQIIFSETGGLIDNFESRFLFAYLILLLALTALLALVAWHRRRNVRWLRARTSS